MNSTSNGAHKLTNWGLILTVPVCVILAILFIISSVSESGHPITAEPLEPVWYTPQTARGDDLKNKVMVGNCYLCHAYWVGIPDPDVVRPEFAHGVIKLNHGANDRCYNCHLIQDRNKYAANDGSGIMHGNVEKMCARCHGLIYNDWQNGTHGVRRGQWSAQSVFERQTFDCTECHDPHSPRFLFKTYAPPPVWPDKYIRRTIKITDHRSVSESS